MTTKLKFSVLASLVAAAISAQADTTNLLQSVNVSFTAFSQGAPITTSTGTNFVISHHSFGTKDLIRAVSASGTFNNGDLLVRATPVTNVPVTVTNLVPIGTNTLEITNTSTDTLILSNELIFNTNAPVPISNLNVTFSTNTEVIGTNTVTIGTNTATAGTNTIVVGTDTTVTATIITNQVGLITGTNYVFISNTLTNSTSGTNILGTATWDIYNHGTLTPISTNVTFNIYTREVYQDTNALALIHGETVNKNNVIRFGVTEEIRAFVLSNSTVNIGLQGYAHGHYVPISLGRGDTVTSHDFGWAGDGSGVMSSNVVVMEGEITESFFKFLK